MPARAGCRWWELDPPAGVAAAEFGVSGDGLEAGLGGGVLPFLAVVHDLGEDLFSLLVVVVQGAVAGGQGLVPPGATVVAGLAGGGGFGVGAAGAQAVTAA